MSEVKCFWDSVYSSTIAFVKYYEYCRRETLLLSIALLKVPYICFRESKPGKSTRIKGQCLRNRGFRGLRPTSVGGLQAPTNCILSREIHCLSVVLQKPCCSVSCLRKVITVIVPYLSESGKLI
jgi:hypothetical protein